MRLIWRPIWKPPKALAVLGIVVGVVTVVLVASVLANARNQIALLFRELGVQILIPTAVNGWPLVARAGGVESDSVLVEGASASFFDVVGAEFTAGRPFTDLEDRAYVEVEAVLRRLRNLEATQENDFTLSTADQIIGVFDQVGAQIGLATVALAGVSLLIGAIGIANVTIISVTERTREIGLRLALKLVVQSFSAVPPSWSVAAGLICSIGVGVVAGWLPARRAASMGPAEALRHE
jgi:ABC-type antimicrobial peptide transport system permease subunit